MQFHVIVVCDQHEYYDSLPDSDVDGDQLCNLVVIISKKYTLIVKTLDKF